MTDRGWMLSSRLLGIAVPALLLAGCFESGSGVLTPDGGHRDSGNAVADGGGNLCATGKLTCGEHAACVDDPDEGSVCRCQSGFTGDGQTCTDIDECHGEVRACAQHATCTNFSGGYNCVCDPGYLGNGHSCEPSPLGLCGTNNGGCDANASCSTVNDQVSCACHEGYSGDGHTCTVVPACASNPCDDHATCTDLPNGGFLCECNSGFHGTGYTCSDIDECRSGLSDCGVDALCTNTLGSFTCSCAMGFTGNGYECTDVDECTDGSAHCAANASCINTAGSYTCACPAGYQGDGHTCTVLDRCALGLAHCGANAYCQASGESYQCLCASGFHGDGYTCTDIDECSTGAAHCAAHAHCLNEPGSFSCTCDIGYAGDGTSACTFIDACTDGTATCAADAICSAYIGGYSCACRIGFSGNGETCSDIDECQRGSSNCDANATCTNTRGGFTCACNDGWTGDGVSCTDVNECDSSTRVCGSGSCQNTPGDYYCQCPAGKEGGPNCIPVGKHITAADTFGCSISSTSAASDLRCWGSNSGGALGLGTTTESMKTAKVGAPSQWTLVSSSTTHACALRADKTLWCWGKPDLDPTHNSTTPTQVGGFSDWVDVAVGGSFTCGLRSAGTLWCWGRNDLGQLGDGTITSTNSPHQIGASSRWTLVTAGDHHACGIQDGVLSCWGGNDSGQLGIAGSPTGASTATPVATPNHWGSVRAGPFTTCGIRYDGTLWCWGDNRKGQLGLGTLTGVTVPTKVGSAAWSSVGPGLTHTCGIQTTGKAFCWGDNSNGQLGTGNVTASTTPTQIDPTHPITDWVEIVAGANFTCARHGNNSVQCWGSNDSARLGNGLDASTPQGVAGGRTWLQIAAGAKSACGVSASNALLCWGDNSTGQLGNGNLDGQNVPVLVNPVSGTLQWGQVAVGTGHACGVTTGGQIYCWGDNTYGQAGIDPAIAVSVPRPTAITLSPDISPNNWRTVAAGAHHTCALKDGVNGGLDLFCWGRNDSGQLGIGNQTSTYVVTQVGTTLWEHVSAGDAHTCAIDGSGGDGSGQLYCWGSNTYGQVGNGSQNMQLTPQPILGVSSWTSVFLGRAVSCGVGTDQMITSLYCWGLNTAGQVGIQSTSSPILSPSRISSGTETQWDWQTAPFTGAGGDTHVCALQKDNTLWCWGRNEKGEFCDNQAQPLPPLRVPPSNITAPQKSTATGTTVSAGSQFTCVLNGVQATCYGRNDLGQLGNGLAWANAPTSQQAVP